MNQPDLRDVFFERRRCTVPGWSAAMTLADAVERIATPDESTPNP